MYAARVYRLFPKRTRFLALGESRGTVNALPSRYGIRNGIGIGCSKDNEGTVRYPEISTTENHRKTAESNERNDCVHRVVGETERDFGYVATRPTVLIHVFCKSRKNSVVVASCVNIDRLSRRCVTASPYRSSVSFPRGRAQVCILFRACTQDHRRFV